MTAKLSPKQHKEDSFAETETFGTLIKKWEDERPIPEPEAEFADVDGVRKLVTVFFFGHLCKMFNIKNDYADMYEEEVAKYTVSRPQQVQDVADDESDYTDTLFREARAVPEESDTPVEGGE